MIKIKNYYSVDDVLQIIQREIKASISYDDRTGLYKIPEIGMIIKAWNKKIEFYNLEEMKSTMIENIMKISKAIDYHIEYTEDEPEPTAEVVYNIMDPTPETNDEESELGR